MQPLRQRGLAQFPERWLARVRVLSRSKSSHGLIVVASPPSFFPVQHGLSFSRWRCCVERGVRQSWTMSSKDGEDGLRNALHQSPLHVQERLLRSRHGYCSEIAGASAKLTRAGRGKHVWTFHGFAWYFKALSVGMTRT